MPRMKIRMKSKEELIFGVQEGDPCWRDGPVRTSDFVSVYSDESFIRGGPVASFLVSKKRAGVGSSASVRPRRHSRAARRPGRHANPSTERDRHVVFGASRRASRRARAGRENTRCNPARREIPTPNGSQRDANTWEMGTGGTAGTADSPTKRDLHRVTTQEKLFQSEFNAPRGALLDERRGGAVDPAGLLAPETSPHTRLQLRLAGGQPGHRLRRVLPFDHGEESTRELMAGVFLPSCGDVDMTDNSSKGESRARHPAAPLAPKRTIFPI